MLHPKMQKGRAYALPLRLLGFPMCCLPAGIRLAIPMTIQAPPPVHGAKLPVATPHAAFAGARKAVGVTIIPLQAMPPEPAQALAVPGARFDPARAGKKFALNALGQGARMFVATVPVVPIVRAAVTVIVMAQVVPVAGDMILVVLRVGNGRAQNGKGCNPRDYLGHVFTVGAGRRSAQTGHGHCGCHDECNELAMHWSG